MLQPPIVRTAGNRHDVGYQHGTGARELVHGTLDWSLQELHNGGVARAEARKRASQFLPFIKAHTPELLDEAEGIAEGADLDLLDIVIINTRYEVLMLDGSDRSRPGVAGAACTLFGLNAEATGLGQAIIGQNVDLGPRSQHLWILLDQRVADTPRIATITLAGMLAQEGMNEAGIALCGSMVRSGDWRLGLPTRKFLRRRVLETRDLRAAVSAIEAVETRASSHNLLLADAEHVIGVETSASQVRVLNSPSGRMAHANHYQSPDFLHFNSLISDYLVNSKARERRMQTLIDGLSPPVSLEALAAILSDHAGEPHAICRHADRDAWGGETNVAVIAVPSTRTLHVAIGPPCSHEFLRYTLA